MERSSSSSDYGAFTEKFMLQLPHHSSNQFPLSGLTFAVKDIFDMKGHVSGFGNPDWARTHEVATKTAPVVSSLLEAGAICVGRTVMDEMAYSINGENAHYGTPTNPCAADRVPGGSSSGSAVAVGANLADFSLGTDTGGSIRVPASYCGISGIRPSHGVVSTSGVIPMAQSFDTVGWFARDPTMLYRIGKILLGLKDDDGPRLDQLIIAEDCFKLLDIPSHLLIDPVITSVQELYESPKIQHLNLGSFIEANVPSLKHFMDEKQESENVPQSLAAVSRSMRLLQRYEFKKNHGEWVRSVKPNIGPGLEERIWEAIESTDEHIDECRSVKNELRIALNDLLGEYDVLVMPTVPGHPPKLQTEPKELEDFRAKAFALLSVAGLSGFCQVSIPLGKHEGLPIAVSLVARHGCDGFLLSFVDTLHKAILRDRSFGRMDLDLRSDFN